ncbi:DUF2759 domain-containing protein [Bacillus massiliigorillae]|uniref:DUF2759 domain-containing protein n=1 Tax=Bacillus massiliigorillae TaxID=1243664 RepID=UPI00039B5F0C|nr:DUF2759 domain-containing protein [Bacillus massiliigorillae]
MGVVPIFGLVAILAVIGLLNSFRKRNPLGIIFAFGTAAVFGWFAIMTAIHHGIPVAH